jgi:tetratricopeptide (TPR) repeat protein
MTGLFMQTQRRLAPLLLFFFACLGLSSLSFAQTKNPPKSQPAPQETISKEDLAKAKELVAEADSHYKTNDYEKALELYKEAYVLSKRPELLFNLGQCYRSMKQHENAVKSYTRFLDDYKKKSPLRDKAKKFLEESQAAFDEEKRIAALTPIEPPKPIVVPIEPPKPDPVVTVVVPPKEKEPFERPARAKRFYRLGLLSSTAALATGGTAIFFSLQAAKLAPTSAADASGSEIQAKIAQARVLSIVSDASLGLALLTFPVGLVANKKAKTNWEKQASLQLSPTSASLAVRF